MRHPASAYVQGINDLAAPMVLVFLTAAVAKKQRLEKTDSDGQEAEEGKEVFVAGGQVAQKV